MSTTTVTNTLTGVPAGQTVTAQLVVSGFDTVGKTQIPHGAPLYTTTASDGSYSFALRPNAELQPTGSYWIITHPGGEAFAVIVPASVSPVWLYDILVASPTTPLQVVGVTQTQLAAYSTVAKSPARFLAKAQAGGAVKVTIIGDSVYQGTTASIPGTNDAVSLFASTIASRYGVAVTKSNLSQGGRTAWWEKLDKWATALTDNADLYLIAMTGKNDGSWETGIQAQTGYERGASLAQIESMVRELLYSKPSSDIMIASGNPYSSASATSNTAQKAYSAGLSRIAAAYGLPYADGWNLFPRATGFPDAADSAYLTDGVHPNDAGHAVLGGVLSALCPATFEISKVAASSALSSEPAPPACVYPVRQSRSGVKSATTASTATLTDRLITPAFTGTWTAGNAGPWTSSTVGASAWFTARATDVFAQFTYGVGQGAIDIHVDGKLIASAVDLSALTAGKWLALGTGLPPGVHNVRLVVASGTVTLTALGWTSSPCEFVPITSTRLATANLGAADNTNEWFGIVSNASTTTTTVAFSFVGTGFLLQGRSASGGSGGFYFASISVDGANVTSPIWPANMLAEVANVALPGCTGLEYGKHTVTITCQAAGLFLGGVSIIDDRLELHPTSCEGMAKVGETVTFPYVWTDLPSVIVTSTTANAAGASTITPTSFVITGTAGDLVRWRATSAQRGVY